MMNAIPYLRLSDEENAGLGKEQKDRKKVKESEKQRKRKQETRPGPSSKTDSSDDSSEPKQKKNKKFEIKEKVIRKKQNADYFVEKLTKIVHTDHIVTCDNWFSSIPLIKKMQKEYVISMTGKLRKNKAEIPPYFLALKKKINRFLVLTKTKF